MDRLFRADRARKRADMAQADGAPLRRTLDKRRRVLATTVESLIVRIEMRRTAGARGPVPRTSWAGASLRRHSADLREDSNRLLEYSRGLKRHKARKAD